MGTTGKREPSDDDVVTVSLPRRLFTMNAPMPATVTQRTSLALFGLPPKHFLRLASSGAFPVKVEGKLRVARYADVETYLTSGAAVRTSARKASGKGPTAPSAPAAGKPDEALVIRHLEKAGYRMPGR